MEIKSSVKIWEEVHTENFKPKDSKLWVSVDGLKSWINKYSNKSLANLYKELISATEVKDDE